MKLKLATALKTDIIFQFKQGFYLVYAILTLFYVIVIGALPAWLKSYAVPLVVFSDPSLVGFIFTGGIIMLETQQGVLEYLSVTPLKLRDYLLAKAAAMALFSGIAGSAIILATYRGTLNWVFALIGIVLSSFFFTLLGVISAAGCRSVNHYFIRMIPYMLLSILPCAVLLHFPYRELLLVFPGGAGIRLVYGAFHGIGGWETLVSVISLIVWNGAILKAAIRVMEKRAMKGGG